MTLKVASFKIFLFSFCFLLMAGGISANKLTQEFFPFLAESTSDHVNVRAGQSANFESLVQLNKGDSVVVVGRNYSWYKIELPSNAGSYISDKYTIPLGKAYGLITSNRVNVRAGADINFSVLGQLNKGDKIRILEKLDGWYKIDSIANSYGWVKDDFLKYKSKHVIVSEKVPPVKDVELIAEPVEQIKETVKQSASSRKKSRSREVVVNGYLKPLKKKKSRNIYYLLIINKQPVYFLRGRRNEFKPFEQFKVTVKGFLEEIPEDKFEFPVLNVSKVKIFI